MRKILGRTTYSLFETIENGNPYAAAARKSFVRELMRLEKKLEKGRITES
jgi:hypothetical protein